MVDKKQEYQHVTMGPLDGTSRNSPVTIIWRAPNGDNRAVEHQLVTLHRELMRTCDEVERVIVHEGLGDVAAKEEPRTAWR